MEIHDHYQKVTCFNQRDGAVGGTKWISYWNHIEETIGVLVVNQKNLVVAARFGRGSKEPWSAFGKVGCASRGDECFKAKDKAHNPLSLLDGGIWQFEDGTCLYEGQIFDLLKRSKRNHAKQWELYSNKSMKLFERHLSPTRKMKSYTNYAWRLIDEWCPTWCAAFRTGKMQTHSRFAFESSTHESEE